MAGSFLVVEDEALVSADICSMLHAKFQGSSARQVRDLQEAKLALEDQDFDAALVDLRLGTQYDGFHVAEAVKAKGRSTPIIFVTGHTDHELLDRMSGFHPDAVVVKPFSPVQLQIAVHNALRRRDSTTGVEQAALSDSNLDADRVRQRLRFYEDTLDKIAIVSVTDAAGRIISANKKFCSISGYSEQEVLGQNHRILNSGSHPPEFWTDMYRTVARGDVWTGTVRNVRKDGQHYVVKSYIAGYFDSRGQLTNFFSIRFDVTHDEERLEYLRMRDQMLKNAISQDVVSSFIGGVSHHINNIIAVTPIIMSRARKSLEADDRPALETSLGRMHIVCERLEGFVKTLNEIADLSGFADKADFRQMDLLSFLNAAIDFAKRATPTLGQRVIMHVPHGLKLAVNIMPRELTAVVQQILKNALEANAEQSDLQITVSLAMLENVVTISFQDNGSGFGEERLKMAMLPFYSTKSAVYGVGTGLSYADKVMRGHNGVIYLQDTDEGARVTLELPYSKDLT